MTYAGIDLGHAGVIAIMESGVITKFHPMPTTTLAGKKTVCRRGLKSALDIKGDFTVIVEQASSHLQSQKVAASMWFAFRGIIDTCEDLGLRYVIVSAKKWQAEFSFKSGNTKEQSVATFRSLFPDVPVPMMGKRGKRAETPDDNATDAGLLAEYGRRKAL